MAMEENDFRHKRNRGEEESSASNMKRKSDIKETYELLRDHNYLPKMFRGARYNYDPPNIAKFLTFFINLEKDNIEKRTQNIKNRFSEGQLEETETEAKEVAKLITRDPRYGDFLDTDFIKLLCDFLCNQQNRGLQFLAVTIIRHVTASTNKNVAKQYLTSSIILDLISSQDRELQVEAMWLLRTVSLRIPDHPEFATIVEKAVDPVISFFNDGSPTPEMKYLGALILATFCDVYPNLTEEKFKSILIALRKLILQYDIEEDLADTILPYACYALAYLCYGRKTMVVENDFFGEVIERLIEFIDSEYRLIVNAGLGALGGIVRWARDDHIQVMIEKGLLWSLERSLREEHKYFVIGSGLILSNITARKQVFLKDVIHCGCIESLVSVVQNFKFIEGKKEAAWAIMNAISGASNEYIEFLKKKCVKALWNFPTVCSGDLNIVCTCLKVLVQMKVVMVKCDGELIDDVQFKNQLTMLQERRFRLDDDADGVPQSKQERKFQLDDDADGVPKSKKLRISDNLGKYDCDKEYLITLTFEEDSDLQQPDTSSISIHNRDMRHVLFLVREHGARLACSRSTDGSIDE